MQIGDLTLVGTWPLHLVKAMATAARVHDVYNGQPDVLQNYSRETCLFTSLALRDFLVAVGYPDATVRGVTSLIRAEDKAGKEIWSVGIGVPGQPPIDGKFNGHAICTIPSLGFFVDPTLYQAVRKQWGGALTGMIAGPIFGISGVKVLDRPVLAHAAVELPDRTVEVFWADRPELNWKKDIDFAVKTQRRRNISDELVRMFRAQQENDHA
jgi:hypothetical protein